MRQSRSNHLSTYTLLWLDASVNSVENIHIQRKLRTLLNNFQIFEEVDQCVQYIQSASTNDRLILIVNGRLGQQLIPRIHPFQQVYSIYIHYLNQDFDRPWTHQYNKVKGVYNTLDELIERIKYDRKSQASDEMTEPLSMSICNMHSNDEQTTSDLDGRFVHSQLLIDCLLRMEPTTADKDDLIAFCQKEYHDNDETQKIIQEFGEDYSSDHAIWWYTRETFVYRLLNKSLRSQNIDLLFDLRFIIRDIEQQLQQHRCLSPMLVYRGQRMSNAELELLKQSKGKLISMNSFLSTSLDRKTALVYLDTTNNDNSLQRILFEINADPCREGVKAFADISSCSYFPHESEVLMMLGSVFRLDDIHLDEHQVWIISMTLCSDHDYDLKSVVHHMRNQYGSGQTRLLSFGHVLVDMAHFNDAEKYYRRLLKDLSADHDDLSIVYQALGKVICENGDYPSSLQYLHQSLHIAQQKLRKDHPRLGFIYTSMGEVYQKKGENQQALHSYETALQLWVKAYGDQHEYVAWCWNNIGNIYDAEKNYSQALDYHQQAMAIKERILPSSHPCLGNAYINMGNVYYHLGDYDKALEKYEKTKKIYETSLPPRHPSIANVLKNIGMIHEVRKDLSKALEYYKKTSSIREKYFSALHPDVIDIKQDIDRVLRKIK